MLRNLGIYLLYDSREKYCNFVIYIQCIDV